MLVLTAPTAAVASVLASLRLGSLEPPKLGEGGAGRDDEEDDEGADDAVPAAGVATGVLTAELDTLLLPVPVPRLVAVVGLRLHASRSIREDGTQ